MCPGYEQFQLSSMGGFGQDSGYEPSADELIEVLKYVTNFKNKLNIGTQQIQDNLLFYHCICLLVLFSLAFLFCFRHYDTKKNPRFHLILFLTRNLENLAAADPGLYRTIVDQIKGKKRRMQKHVLNMF